MNKNSKELIYKDTYECIYKVRDNNNKVRIIRIPHPHPTTHTRNK